MSFTVAIDGPAAAGKGTVARAVAEHFGFAHLDTGLLYRATGFQTLEGADPVLAAQRLQHDTFDPQKLRQPDVAQAASRVAALPEVRSALLTYQRDFARRNGGAVLDGRDIGTVICPEAEVKLFVTASDDVRARRRLAELLETGHQTNFDTVFADLQSRDSRDSARDAAPLKPAPNAVTLDTSDMTIAAAVESAIATVSAARAATAKTKAKEDP